jgi:hypothetical protein
MRERLFESERRKDKGRGRKDGERKRLKKTDSMCERKNKIKKEREMRRERRRKKMCVRVNESVCGRFKHTIL